MMDMIDNIQHRGAEFTELHRDSLRPLRFSLCASALKIQNSNAKTQRFYAKDAKKCLKVLCLKSHISKSQIFKPI